MNRLLFVCLILGTHTTGNVVNIVMHGPKCTNTEELKSRSRLSEMFMLLNAQDALFRRYLQNCAGSFKLLTLRGGCLHAFEPMETDLEPGDIC